MDDSASARLVPLRPGWHAAPPQPAGGAAYHPQQQYEQQQANAWHQPHGTAGRRPEAFTPRTPSAEVGDFWADQADFAADMARLQLRGPQPSSARSGAGGARRAAFEPDMEDVWAEQAAFEAEVAALEGGDSAEPYDSAQGQPTGTGGEDGDDEEMWRDLAAFEAEMEQLHGEAPAADRGGTSQPRPGLNPGAASFSFGESASSVVPSAVHAGDDDDGWAAGGDGSHGDGPGLGGALDSLQGGSGRPGAGLCPQHRATGECARGAACPYIHGDLCEVPSLPFPARDFADKMKSKLDSKLG